jgi:hypothetical protein
MDWWIWGGEFEGFAVLIREWASDVIGLVAFTLLALLHNARLLKGHCLIEVYLHVDVHSTDKVTVTASAFP